jgi:hypothetical protein
VGCVGYPGRNGIQEVDGSIPFSSTIDFKGLSLGLTPGLFRFCPHFCPHLNPPGGVGAERGD